MRGLSACAGEEPNWLASRTSSIEAVRVEPRVDSLLPFFDCVLNGWFLSTPIRHANDESFFFVSKSLTDCSI